MFTNKIPEKELKLLTDAITNAVVNSKEAREILAKLYKKNLIRSSLMMFLALNIQNIDCIKQGIVKKNSLDHIDGRKLTDKEKEFYEFCAENFDEQEWLKKIGIQDM